jgi:hypothetical protein
VFELPRSGTLPRMLGYFSSYSATKRYRDATAAAIPSPRMRPPSRQAWGDPERVRVKVRWPMFVHARRKAPDVHRI